MEYEKKINPNYLNIYQNKNPLNFRKSSSVIQKQYRQNTEKVSSMITSRLIKLEKVRNQLINNSRNIRGNIDNIHNINPLTSISCVCSSQNSPRGYISPMSSCIYWEPIYGPSLKPKPFPKIEINGPPPQCQHHCCCNDDLKTTNLLVLLNSLNKIPQQIPQQVTLPQIQQEPQIIIIKPKRKLRPKNLHKSISTAKPIVKIINKPPIVQPSIILPATKRKKKKKKIIEPILKEKSIENPQIPPQEPKIEIIEDKIKPKPKRKLRRDWWILAKDFVNLYLYFSTAKKYSTHYAKLRRQNILKKTKMIVGDISLLKQWIIELEDPFWNEFRVFKDLDISFSNNDNKNKIKMQSQKIVALIKKFMENLISKSSKLSDVPLNIQQTLYEYIKDRAYFPRKYLSTFQINRLDFEFYGSTRFVNFKQSGMILAYLVICGVASQQILLHMRDVFPEFIKYPNINKSAKYIGSIIHYLTRDTFEHEPCAIKELFALFNYYRNYHLINQQIENFSDIFNPDLEYLDGENRDEYAKFLVPENEISIFFQLNSNFVEIFHKFIYAWSCKLGKNIKNKFAITDPNLKEINRMQKPANKRAKVMEEDDSEEESNKY